MGGRSARECRSTKCSVRPNATRPRLECERHADQARFDRTRRTRPRRRHRRRCRPGIAAWRASAISLSAVRSGDDAGILAKPGGDRATSTPMAGSLPAISESATKTAISGFRAAPTISSPAAAIASALRRSRMRWPASRGRHGRRHRRAGSGAHGIDQGLRGIKGGISPSSATWLTEIRDFVRDHLARHEVPRDVEFVAALPMTTTEKSCAANCATLNGPKWPGKKNPSANDIPFGCSAVLQARLRDDDV